MHIGSYPETVVNLLAKYLCPTQPLGRTARRRSFSFAQTQSGSAAKQTGNEHSKLDLNHIHTDSATKREDITSEPSQTYEGETYWTGGYTFPCKVAANADGAENIPEIALA